MNGESLPLPAPAGRGGGTAAGEGSSLVPLARRVFEPSQCSFLRPFRPRLVPPQPVLDFVVLFSSCHHLGESSSLGGALLSSMPLTGRPRTVSALDHLTTRPLRHLFVPRRAQGCSHGWSGAQHRATRGKPFDHHRPGSGGRIARPRHTSPVRKHGRSTHRAATRGCARPLSSHLPTSSPAHLLIFARGEAVAQRRARGSSPSRGQIVSSPSATDSLFILWHGLLDRDVASCHARCNTH